MLTKTVLIVMFASSVLSRNVANFKDLDEEDQMLYRAAYDPTYSTYETPYVAPFYSVEYHQDPIDKLDLLKDGMWALKAKLKEMKAFNKALAANLLSTKLKVKELLAHHIQPLKKHKHIELNEKPAYYQSPSPQPSYPQYDPPQYAAPQPAQYAAPQHQHTPPHQAQHYGTTEYDYDPYYGH